MKTEDIVAAVIRRLNHGRNKYANLKPSEQKNTSGQRRFRRQQAAAAAAAKKGA